MDNVNWTMSAICKQVVLVAMDTEMLLKYFSPTTISYINHNMKQWPYDDYWSMLCYFRQSSYFRNFILSSHHLTKRHPFEENFYKTQLAMTDIGVSFNGYWPCIYWDIMDIVFLTTRIYNVHFNSIRGDRIATLQQSQHELFN